MFRILGNTARKQELDTAGCGFLTDREIEAALEDRLPRQRQEQFAAHQVEGCSSCALLSADLQIFGTVQSGGILENERREFNESAAIFKAQLRQELEVQDSQRRSIPAFFKFSWSTAASLAAAALLIVAVSVTFMQGPQNVIQLPNGEKYAVQAMAYLQPLETRGQSVTELWQRAGAAYQAGDYDQAATTFAQIAERDPGSHDAALYQGISLVMLGEHEQAIAPLRCATRIAESQGLSGTAHYFLGLAALGQNDQTLATLSLERALELGGRYQQQTREMLDSLEID